MAQSSNRRGVDRVAAILAVTLAASNHGSVPQTRPGPHHDQIAAGTCRGRISVVTSKPTEAEQLSDLARLRRVRDRSDREYAQPLDVEALARGANMSAGHLSREFKAAYGEAPYGYLMTR